MDFDLDEVMKILPSPKSDGCFVVANGQILGFAFDLIFLHTFVHCSLSLMDFTLLVGMKFDLEENMDSKPDRGVTVAWT